MCSHKCVCSGVARSLLVVSLHIITFLFISVECWCLWVEESCFSYMALTDSFYIALIICLTNSKSSFSLCRSNTITRSFAALVSHGSHLVKRPIHDRNYKSSCNNVCFLCRNGAEFVSITYEDLCFWNYDFQALEWQNCLRWAVLSPLLLTRSNFHAPVDCGLFGIRTILHFSRIGPSMLFQFIIKFQVSWHLVDFFLSEDRSIAH
jgi:hypothetical protein